MAKDPAFLFYPGDWLGGTHGMSFEEKGAYFELLVMQFNRGHMTEHMIGQAVGQIWDKLKPKFKIDEKGLWYNDRLDEEKEKRKSYVKSRVNNKSGNNQYSKNGEKKSGHTTSHMEDENINSITSIKEVSNKDRENTILGKMLKAWTIQNENYQVEEDNDLPALLKIAHKIAKVKKIEKKDIFNGKLESIIDSWETIVKFIRKDDFYKKLELTTIEKKWAGLFQSMGAAREGSTKETRMDKPKEMVI